MPSGGMRWNSRLPKRNAGRPKGSKDGDANPGIKGGGTKRRTPGQKKTDPLYIPGGYGSQMAGQPEFLTVDDVVHGARAVQEILSKRRWENRFEDVLDALFDEGMGFQRDEEGAVAKKGQRNVKALELLLQYKYGKPVTLNENLNRDISAEDVAAMAEKVRGQLTVVPPSEAAG